MREEIRNFTIESFDGLLSIVKNPFFLALSKNYFELKGAIYSVYKEELSRIGKLLNSKKVRIYFPDSQQLLFIIHDSPPDSENIATASLLLSKYVADLNNIAKKQSGMPVSVGTTLNFYYEYLPGDNSVAKLGEIIWEQIRRLRREYAPKNARK